MPLPHFTQLLMTGSPGGPGTLPEEPVYLNLFEITFIFPTILQAQGRDPIMQLQQAASVNLDLTPEIATSVQRFKYSTRAYMNTPEKTHIDFTIKHNVNVNDKGNMTTWNTLKAWYDVVWNSQNGVVNYKSDIIGTVIVNHHDKKGVVLRRVTFQNCQISKLAGYELDWSSANIVDNLAVDFVYDYFIDEYIDNGFSINPPLVSGY
jgi:hypothetical protein